MKTLSLLVLLLTSGMSLAEDMKTNSISDSETISVFKDLLSEIKSNKDFRKLLRHSRNKDNLVARETLKEKIKNHFLSRGVELGYFAAGSYSSYSLISYGESDGPNYDQAYAENFGPGLGVSRGYQIIACTYQRMAPGKIDGNHGLSLTAVIGLGITSAITVGENGACLTLGIGVGFEIQTGYTRRYI